MPQATTPLAERIARVLAGLDRSANAGGGDAHAAVAVDQAWRDYSDRALAVIHELREPDAAMAAVGDSETWSAMVDAALAPMEGKAPR